MKTQQQITEEKEAMQPFWDGIENKARKNAAADEKLQAFCTEPCEIHTYERIAITDHCDFIRFTYDNEDCIAIEWDDGSVYTPDDWQANWLGFDPFKNEDDDLAEIDWVDCDQHRAIMLNGLPRTLVTH